MKVGIIGLGAMGGTHHSLLKAKGVTPHIVCDGDESKFAQFDATQHTTNYMDVINQSDIVFIATPTNLHAEMALASIEAGKATFLQKPMARTLDEAVAIREKVKEKGVPFQVGYIMRFSEAMKKLKQGISEIGNPVVWKEMWAVNGQGYPGWLFKQEGGGPLFEDSHMMDLALWCLGSKPIHVVANIQQFCNFKYNDTVSMMITYENGSCLLWGDSWARGSSGQSSREPRRTFDIVGPKGHLCHPVKYKKEEDVQTTMKYDTNGQEQSSFAWNHLGIGGAYVSELDGFLDRVDGKESGGCTVDEAFEVMRILDACERSNGKGVSL